MLNARKPFFFYLFAKLVKNKPIIDQWIILKAGHQ